MLPLLVVQVARSPSDSVIATPRWRRPRAEILDRARRLDVDHMIPMGPGGDPWEPGNLHALYRTCHIRKTRQENRKAPTSGERPRRCGAGG